MTLSARVVLALSLPLLFTTITIDATSSGNGPAIAFRSAFAQETSVRTNIKTEQQHCESYCSYTKPGASVMEIKFSVAGQPMTETELRTRVNQQPLEVTVYYQGFERGLFARVESVKPTDRFQPAQATRLPEKPIPGLENLVITAITTSKDEQDATRLRATGTGRDTGESIVVQVEGIQPGLYYSWRVPVAATGGRQTEILTCQAAICPVDTEQEGK